MTGHKDFVYPVAYLENQDFNANGNLVAPGIPQNIPVVIMVWASWCPHCVNSQEMFQSFANQNKDRIFCACIQSDGVKETEKELGKRIKSLKPTFRGFPDFLLYQNGNRIEAECNERSIEGLTKFVQQNL